MAERRQLGYEQDPYWRGVMDPETPPLPDTLFQTAGARSEAPTSSTQPVPPPSYVPPSTPEIQQAEQQSGGGYLAGVGATVAPGRSITADQAGSQTASALAAGVPQAFIDSFLAANPGDTNRLVEAYRSGGPRDDPRNYDTLLDDPRPGSAPGPTSAPRSQPAPAPLDLNAILDLVATINREGTDQMGDVAGLPGPGELPIIEVPGADLSPDIDASLLSLMRGEDETTIRTGEAIRNLLAETQGGGLNEDRLTKRRLGTAERFGVAQRNAEEQLRAQLADRGLVSLPGAPQGAETAGQRRSLERLAVPFAQELREADIRESELADARELSALQLATGWSNDQAARVLNAATAGTDRQRVLSEIALGTLDRNIAWNSYLADFGIRREQLMHDIQTGRLDRVLGILDRFLLLAKQSAQGYIGQE